VFDPDRSGGKEVLEVWEALQGNRFGNGKIADRARKLLLSGLLRHSEERSNSFRDGSGLEF